MSRYDCQSETNGVDPRRRYRFNKRNENRWSRSKLTDLRSKPLPGYSFVYSRLVSRDGTVAGVNDDFRHVTSTFRNVMQPRVPADRALPVNPR